MESGSAPRRGRPRALAWWLVAVAALVILMVVVGGITRLTESGLSITRWAPVSGAIPPLSAAEWQAEFAAYQATPEYRLLTHGMSLADFQRIFFWEYLHRLIGRLIGLAFAIPFAVFALKRWIPAGYGWRLAALLALGGLQGAVGWWMVASGLVDRPDVSHVRLAVHLSLACLILAGLVWTALDLFALARDPVARPARLTGVAIAAGIALAIQLVLGAFVAGLDAGRIYGQWPLMGSGLMPGEIGEDARVFWQFLHRWWAFAAAGVLVWFGLRADAVAGTGQRFTHHLGGLVTLQIGLGIATLVSGVAIGLAALHQAVAALIVATLTWAAHRAGSAA
ncbi:MAG: COX15/CtaA family protein [Sphingomonadaceae bacterium]|nr:COX15/CtaA family protein [Sphingomonadaceae bacterium]